MLIYKNYSLKQPPHILSTSRRNAESYRDTVLIYMWTFFFYQGISEQLYSCPDDEYLWKFASVLLYLKHMYYNSLKK